eukprot:3420706-Amphidinium_carterae.2
MLGFPASLHHGGGWVSCNTQRQFPGMYPTIAGLIGSNGPYKSVGDIYNIKGLTEPMKTVLKQYEGNLVCFPADPAYFIDRVNNGLYR